MSQPSPDEVPRSSRTAEARPAEDVHGGAARVVSPGIRLATWLPRRRCARAAGCALLSLIVAAWPIQGATPLASSPAGIGADTIHVAPPTGEQDADRASIMAAFERARPGGTIQFAAGLYLVGDLIRLETPRLPLSGHPNGTTLPGCELEGGAGNRVTGPGGVTSAGAPAEGVGQVPVQNPPLSGFVDAEGARIHFLDHGGTGPPLVFLPGLGHNAHLFDDFAPRFTDAHRVVAITRRGHAPSTGSDADFDLDTLIRDILTVLDTLGIERAAFVGHSYGGFEMTRLAGDFPERVDRLIYLDAAHDYVAFLHTVFDRCPPPPPMTATDSASWKTVAAFQSRQTRFAWSESVVRSYHTFGADGRLRSGVVDPAFAERLIAVEESPRYDRLEAPALAIYHVPAVPWSEPSALHWYHALGDDQQVTGECLAALQDFVEGSVHQFSNQTGQGQVIRLPDGTHYPFLARPTEVERAMRAFLMATGLGPPAA
jgi:non-heme chloroperoxidase